MPEVHMAEEFKLATAGDDIKVWDLKSFSVTEQYNPHSSGISDICWSHNNQLIASASTCADKVVLSFVKNKASSVIEVAENSKPTCVTLNSNSRYLASAGKNQLVQVWDTKSCKLKKTYKGHQDTINCVRFNWNDTYLASGSANGEIYLHNVVSGIASKPLVSPGTQSIQQIGYSYFKKSLLAAVSDDGALNLWDSNTSKSVASFTDSHRAPATALSFSPVNDMLLASAGLDKRIVCYSVQAKSTIKTITADAPLTSMAFATDGATLAAGTTRGKVLVYDLRMGALPIRTLIAHKTSVQTVAFSKATNNKGETISSETKASLTSSSRNKLIAGEPQITSAVQNGLKPGKHETKEITQNGSAGIRTSSDTLTSKDNQSADVLFSPIREGTTLTTKDSLSNGLSARPEVLGKASTPKADSIGGVFSPLAEISSVPHTRGNPVGSVSISPTSYQVKQPTTGDVTIGPGGTTGPSTPTTTMSPRSTHVGLSPRHTRKSPSRTSVGTLDLDTSQFKVNASSSSRLESPRLEEVLPRPGMTNNSKADTDEDINAISARRSSEPFVSATNPSSISIPHVNGPTGDSASEGTKQYTTVPTSQAGGFQSFQIDFIKNMIDDSLEEVRDSIHHDIRNLQLEMLRQFQIQQSQMQVMLEKYSVNEGLLNEIERLKEENKLLKSKY